ncbi:peritrophin-1-like [Condylostylus longicornis]|uniref:peritrophin-1-like n=1 Tax=Condylostylus longicornis TaxID=2530218 RepID=UPI00244E50D9|nr:peritrophin-1-like [Condylostylus longicornis]
MKILISSIIFVIIAITSFAYSANIKCPEVSESSEAVLLPNPKNCSQYYHCDAGEPILKECPHKLHFNPKLLVCDFPNRAKCKLQ